MSKEARKYLKKLQKAKPLITTSEAMQSYADEQIIKAYQMGVRDACDYCEIGGEYPQAEDYLQTLNN